MRQGVSEVGVVSEDVAGEEGRDDWTPGGSVEHEDQDANVWAGRVEGMGECAGVGGVDGVKDKEEWGRKERGKRQEVRGREK